MMATTAIERAMEGLAGERVDWPIAAADSREVASTLARLLADWYGGTWEVRASPDTAGRFHLQAEGLTDSLREKAAAFGIGYLLGRREGR